MTPFWFQSGKRRIYARLLRPACVQRPCGTQHMRCASMGAVSIALLRSSYLCRSTRFGEDLRSANSMHSHGAAVLTLCASYRSGVLPLREDQPSWYIPQLLMRSTMINTIQNKALSTAPAIYYPLSKIAKWFANTRTHSAAFALNSIRLRQSRSHQTTMRLSPSHENHKDGNRELSPSRKRHDGVPPSFIAVSIRGAKYFTFLQTIANAAQKARSLNKMTTAEITSQITLMQTIRAAICKVFFLQSLPPRGRRQEVNEKRVKERTI